MTKLQLIQCSHGYCKEPHIVFGISSRTLSLTLTIELNCSLSNNIWAEAISRGFNSIDITVLRCICTELYLWSFAVARVILNHKNNSTFIPDGFKSEGSFVEREVNLPLLYFHSQVALANQCLPPLYSCSARFGRDLSKKWGMRQNDCWVLGFIVSRLLAVQNL